MRCVAGVLDIRHPVAWGRKTTHLRVASNSLGCILPGREQVPYIGVRSANVWTHTLDPHCGSKNSESRGACLVNFWLGQPAKMVPRRKTAVPAALTDSRLPRTLTNPFSTSAHHI